MKMHIDLNELRYTGTLPPEWGSDQSSLNAVGLATNRLRGTLPAQWVNLKNITELYLHDNLLSGMNFSLPRGNTTGNYGNMFGTTADL